MLARQNTYLSLSFLAFACLVSIPLSLMAYKICWLDYRLGDVLPRTQYRVNIAMSLDGHSGRVKVRTFLPIDDEHQRISEEEHEAGTFRFATELEGANRTAIWLGSSVADESRLRYGFSVLTTGLRFELDPALSVPDSYPDFVVAHLRPTEAIQVDSTEIRAKAKQIGATNGGIVARLRRIFEYTNSLGARPFKGLTDALTALRLGEASCNGKSRLFVALSRAAGIPARLVGGLLLEPGDKRTSHQWVEAYISGRWVSFDPTNARFAELPANYLVLYRGDEALFKHTSDINFDYSFSTSSKLVPSPRVRETFRAFNVWDLFARLKLPFSLLRTVLMLPVGALVVVLFRNVVGVPTFGTFLPALIAAAAGETGLLWGVVGVLIVAFAVVLSRLLVQRLSLLHSPTLAILLSVVVLSMLATSFFADRLGLEHLAKTAYFPIAVLAIASERLYLTLAERGVQEAAKHLLGTLLVMLGCYVVMNSLAMQVLVSGFPEMLLLVVAANIYLGRWVGLRVLEHWRFRSLLKPRTVS